MNGHLPIRHRQYASVLICFAYMEHRAVRLECCDICAVSDTRVSGLLLTAAACHDKHDCGQYSEYYYSGYSKFLHSCILLFSLCIYSLLSHCLSCMINIDLLYVCDPSQAFDLAAYIVSSESCACIYSLISAFNFKFTAIDETIVP